MNRFQVGKDVDKYATSVQLLDGSSLHIRPIRADDEDRMLALFGRFTPQTIYLRFHHILKQMSREEVKRFCEVDYQNTLALVATVCQPNEEKIIGVARYYRYPDKSSAEFAIVVEDMFHGKGIGTQLLRRLAEIAREKGIVTFIGEVMADNYEIIRMLKNSGFQINHKISKGVHQVIIDLNLN